MLKLYSTLQGELIDEIASSRCGLPPALNMLAAKNYLYARDRLRGHLPLPDFRRIAHVPTGSSSNENTFSLMKAALLAIEAALPIGCVDATSKGMWRPEFAEQWRSIVKSATGPAMLTKSTIFLEDSIGEDWIKPDVGHLRSCLPARWKAVAEASASSLAIRIILLDRSIKYGTIDRKRFSTKKKH